MGGSSARVRHSETADGRRSGGSTIRAKYLTVYSFLVQLCTIAARSSTRLRSSASCLTRQVTCDE
eukprot:3271952-Prymnesium_polylepis.1